MFKQPVKVGNLRIMKKRFNTPRGGMVAALCAALTALWLTAVYGTYEENKREKYDVHITPGAVSYGTHSSATVPVVMTTTRYTSSVPMVSGNAVRSYAHYGHASMPSSTSSGKGLYATSSATVHTVGSGGGASGGGVATSSGASSSRGIRYGGGAVASVAMPVLAVNSSMMAAPVVATEPSMPRAIGPRRAKPTEPGADGEWSDAGAGDGKWYRWDDWAGEWVTPEVGDTRIEGGVTYEWNGTKWDPVGDQGDPTNPQPLGATPWLLIALLACAYALYKYYTQVYNKSK